MDFSTIPAGAPPPGVTPNPDNPPDRLLIMTISLLVIQALTLPFVVLRISVNFLMRRIFIEDVFLYIAWCFFAAQTALIINGGTKGVAKHLWDMTYEELLLGAHEYNRAVICYALAGGFAKAAVFLQLKKIFTTTLRGTVYWVIIISLIVNAIAYTILLFLYIFNCWPVSKQLNPLIPGRCLDWRRSVIAIGSINLISDIEALCVPAWAIWRLRLNIKKKLEVFAVFAISGVAIAIACLGLWSRVLAAQNYDYPWYLVQSGIFNVAEIGSVIVVGCCPAIPRLFRHNRDKYARSVRPCGNPCCQSGSNGKTKKPRKDPLEDSRDSAGQESNSVVTLEMYGYANSIDHGGSAEISHSEYAHTTSRPITSTDMTA